MKNDKTSHQVLKRYGYYQVKEADVKMLHNVWFQLYVSLQKAKLHRE